MVQINIEDITNYKIKHEKLEKEVITLIREMADGIIDPEYLRINNNFNLDENKISLVSFFRFVLNDETCQFMFLKYIKILLVDKENYMFNNKAT